MRVTPETVRNLCDLARLRLEPDEAERMRRDLERILAYVEKLEELDTEGVPPTSHVVEMATPMRSDEEVRRLSMSEVLRNAPQHAAGAFVVPRVIE
ncbi:MAG: Asp-tRNA(Asn)/Glu-tRNA(Gln) amidotransferase subunit GatC [Myxococcota bacterium]